MHAHATGAIGGHTVQFTPAHREWNDTPVALHVSVSLPMSYDDIVATLWVLVAAGYPPEDLLAHPDGVHGLIIETVLRHGEDLHSARAAIAALTPGSDVAAIAAQLRDAVAEFYGTRLAVAR